MKETLLQFGEYIFDGKFKVEKCIGAGSFGQVYYVRDTANGIQRVCKVEPTDETDPHVPLWWEVKRIHELRGKAQVPEIHHVGPWTGQTGNKLNIAVITLLGKDLEKRFNDCKRKFNLATVLHIAKQMFQTIEVVHEHRFMHRDIKPDNIMTGYQPSELRKIYLCDFGMAKYWVTNRRDEECREHIPFIEGKGMCGTVRYVGVNTHKGFQQCRGDDMETIGHMIMYF